MSLPRTRMYGINDRVVVLHVHATGSNVGVAWITIVNNYRAMVHLYQGLFKSLKVMHCSLFNIVIL